MFLLDSRGLSPRASSLNTIAIGTEHLSRVAVLSLKPSSAVYYAGETGYSFDRSAFISFACIMVLTPMFKVSTRMDERSN